MEETESKPENEEPEVKKEIKQTDEVIDKRIEAAADKKLRERELELENRELKLKEQKREVLKLLDEVERGGKGNVRDEKNPNSESDERIEKAFGGLGLDPLMKKSRGNIS